MLCVVTRFTFSTAGLKSEITIPRLDIIVSLTETSTVDAVWTSPFHAAWSTEVIHKELMETSIANLHETKDYCQHVTITHGKTILAKS